MPQIGAGSAFRDRNFRDARNSEKMSICPTPCGGTSQFVDMPTPPNETRRFPRKAVAVPARLLLGDAEPNEVATVDISEAGVGIIAVAALQAGSSCMPTTAAVASTPGAKSYIPNRSHPAATAAVSALPTWTPSAGFASASCIPERQGPRRPDSFLSGQTCPNDRHRRSESITITLITGK